MNLSNEEGVRLEFSSGRPSITNLADINEALALFGSRIWPLELRSLPITVRQLLN